MPRAVTLSAVVLIAVAGGCTNHRATGHRKATDAQAAAAVGAAYQRTLAARSTRFVVDKRAAVKGKTASVGSTSALDFVSKNVEVTFKLPYGTMHIRRIGQVVYEQAVILSGESASDAGWTRYDLSKPGLPPGSPGSAVPERVAGLSEDAADILGYLQGVSGRVHEVGVDRIRGEQTTHYTAAVDPAKAQAALSPRAAKDLRALLSGPAGGRFPVDVWLDNANRVRKLVYRISGRDGPLELSEQLYDFGTPVHPVPPPASASGG
jgi:hypothetical protein